MSIARISLSRRFNFMNLYYESNFKVDKCLNHQSGISVAPVSSAH